MHISTPINVYFRCHYAFLMILSISFSKAAITGLSLFKVLVELRITFILT